MDAILVVNAGSSSLKFQVFGTDTGGLERLIKGQIDGVGTRPRLRAEYGDKTPLIDESLIHQMRSRIFRRRSITPELGCATPRISISLLLAIASFTAAPNMIGPCWSTTEC
jgi:hypothetical protein